MPALATSPRLDELPASVRFAAEVCASPIVKASGGVAPFSFSPWSAIVEMTGKPLTALTVNKKLALLAPAPSLTVRVIVALPNWFAAGVTATVRTAPLPPKTMFALGTRVGFEETPESVKLATGESTSATMKGRTPVVVPWSIVWFGMLLTVGGSFTGVTVTLKLRATVLFAGPPLFTVSVIVAVPFALADDAKVSEPEVFGLA